MRTTTNAPGQALLVICLASFCWALSFGLGAPLAALWLKQAGSTDTIIGLNTAAYYGGLALAALAAPFLMRRFGPSCATVGMALSGVTVALFPWGGSLSWWFGLRVLGGIAGALCLIPMETYVNRDLPPENRGRNFGLYAVALTLGWALGNWLGLALVAEMPHLAFLTGGAAALIGALVVKTWLPPIPERCQDPTVPLDWHENFLSFGAAWRKDFLKAAWSRFCPFI